VPAENHIRATRPPEAISGVSFSRTARFFGQKVSINPAMPDRQRQLLLFRGSQRTMLQNFDR
jgi:hypothetical protein